MDKGGLGLSRNYKISIFANYANGDNEIMIMRWIIYRQIVFMMIMFKMMILKMSFMITMLMRITKRAMKMMIG